MTRLSCAAGCTLRGRHLDECTDEQQCAGCLPAMAADGLQVCQRCERRTADSLRFLPELYDDLAEPRRGGGLPKFTKGSSPGPKRPEACAKCDAGTPCGRTHRETAQIIEDAARDARSAIRAGLVTWCLLLEEERSISLPADDVQAMSKHVHRHLIGLLGSEHADQIVHDVRFWNEAKMIAYRARPDLTIACECGARVRVDLADTMTCSACGQWGDYQWWASQGVPTEESLTATAQDTLDWLLRTHDLPVTYGTLRVWRTRHKQVSAGRDQKSRALYVKAAVLELAQRSVPRQRSSVSNSA